MFLYHHDFIIIKLIRNFNDNFEMERFILGVLLWWILDFAKDSIFINAALSLQLVSKPGARSHVRLLRGWWRLDSACRMHHLYLWISLYTKYVDTRYMQAAIPFNKPPLLWSRKLKNRSCHLEIIINKYLIKIDDSVWSRINKSKFISNRIIKQD